MTEVVLRNPLPAALAHYEAALVACLSAPGLDVRVAPTVDIAVAASGESRARAAVRAVAERTRSGSHSHGHQLVLWPAFGYLDRLLWTAGRRTTIVFHDPSRLRRQVGLSGLSSSLSSWRSGPGSPRTLVHSERARADVVARGLRVDAVLPLPMLSPTPSWTPGDAVTVLGQFKSARDLGLLERLAPLLRARGLHGVVRGRGWPPVPGWDVVDAFLDEDAFDAAIAGAAAVLLPYAKVFQSDVAVRAAELGVPVVGPRLSNVPELYGDDWGGVVAPDADDDAWAAAVAAAVTADPDEVKARVQGTWAHVRDAWSGWAARL